MGTVHHLLLRMSIRLGKYCVWPVLLYYPFNLVSYYVQSLIPRDSNVMALPPVLHISVAIGIEIYPL